MREGMPLRLRPCDEEPSQKGALRVLPEAAGAAQGEKGGTEMTRIYKYPIPIEDRFSLSLPQGARVLCVQTQNNQPQVWVRVDPHALTERRDFFLRGTGHPCGPEIDAARYVGTFQLEGGALVFHLFEVAQ